MQAGEFAASGEVSSIQLSPAASLQRATVPNLRGAVRSVSEGGTFVCLFVCLGSCSRGSGAVTGAALSSEDGSIAVRARCLSGCRVYGAVSTTRAERGAGARTLGVH